MLDQLEYCFYHWTEIFDSSRSSRRIRAKLNCIGRYGWENRSRCHSTLLVIVAGYKHELWPITLGRIAAQSDAAMDVCVVSAGVESPELRDFCRQHGWSYLWTRANKLALAQNLAIRNHPKAKWIHKLDEDMVVAPGYFRKMSEQAAIFEKKRVQDFGFLAPLINVNGFSSRIFLEKLGKLNEFELQFGVIKQGCMAEPVWTSVEAARALWDLSQPFDSVASRLESGLGSFSLCPFRFSIGAFLMKRELWEEMGGFTVTGSGRLGAEEIDFCAWCHAHSKAMIIAEGVLAGHCGFHLQTAHMVSYLMARKDLMPGSAF